MPGHWRKKMLFRPIEPRGDILEASRHLVALALLLPIAFAALAARLWLTLEASPGMSLSAFTYSYILLVFLPLAGLDARAWIPLAGAIVAVLLIHFVFYTSLMSILHRMRALSLINMLVGTTLLAAAAGVLPVLTGYGISNPKYRLPLLEDFAGTFLFYAVAFGLGALIEWVCVRTVPPKGARA